MNELDFMYLYHSEYQGILPGGEKLLAEYKVPNNKTENDGTWTNGCRTHLAAPDTKLNPDYPTWSLQETVRFSSSNQDSPFLH